MTEQDPAFALVPDVLLVVSELTTNAVKARTNRVVVHLAAHRKHLEVGVEDEDPSPAGRRPPNEQGGRGLRIVEALTSEWGQRVYDGATKRVWCRFEVPPMSALGQGCRL